MVRSPSTLLAAHGPGWLAVDKATELAPEIAGDFHPLSLARQALGYKVFHDPHEGPAFRRGRLPCSGLCNGLGVRARTAGAAGAV